MKPARLADLRAHVRVRPLDPDGRATVVQGVARPVMFIDPRRRPGVQVDDVSRLAAVSAEVRP